MSHILIAYTTTHGSTTGVAEAIADAIRAHGATAEVARMKDIKTVDVYTAVVAGAPIYIGDWSAEAKNFFKHYRASLSQRPVAVFALGPTEPKDEKPDDFKEGQQQFDAILAKFPWLHPVDTALFVGAFDPQNLSFPYSLANLIPANPLKSMPATDNRDWDAIYAWVETLAPKLT